MMRGASGAQAIEPGAGAEDAVVLREDPREVRQRIGGW